MNASWLPAFIDCSAEPRGKFVDDVYPVRYALDESTAIGLVEVTAATKFSFAAPPRYVE